MLRTCECRILSLLSKDGFQTSLHVVDLYFFYVSVAYLVSERKPDSFSKFKEDEDFNRRNTLSILRIKI